MAQSRNWQEAFFAVFDMHLRACDGHGVEPNELESLIGAALMNLWGCAFRALIHLNLDRLYRRQLDEPIPMLGDISLRIAIESKKGLEKVASWIKTLENHMARVPSDDPMAGYEFGWLWEELGIADHRR
jgi:hypothetical protein